MVRWTIGCAVVAVSLAGVGSAVQAQDTVEQVGFGVAPVTDTAQLDSIRGGNDFGDDSLTVGAVAIADQDVANSVTHSTLSAGGDMLADNGSLSNNMMTVNMFSSGINTTMGANVSLNVNIYNSTVGVPD